MSTLPPPNPEQGAAAAKKANEARSNILDAMKAGNMDMESLFRLVDDEGLEHILGHIHLRTALLALPHIGEKRAWDILDQLGLEPHRHLDALGSHQRESILIAIEAAL